MALTKLKFLTILTVVATICTAANVPEEISERRLVPGRSKTEVSPEILPRSLNIPIVRQILTNVFTPIQQIAKTALDFACSSIDPLVTTVDTFRNVVFSDLISLMNVLAPLVMFFPEYNSTLHIIQTVMSVVNETVGNFTQLANTSGCIIIGNIEAAIDGILTSIIGIF